MESPQEQRQVYELFFVSIILKGLISVAEVLTALIILILPAPLLLSIAAWCADYAQTIPAFKSLFLQVSTELMHFTTATAMFVAFYLFSRGAIKVFLVWALLKNKLWAYPASLVFLGALLAYQLYQLLSSYSVFVVGISIFDVIVMYSIFREYKIVREVRAK